MAPAGIGFNLNAIFTDGYGGSVAYSNLTNSNPEVATALISAGHLQLVKVGSGTTTVTFDVAESRGVKMIITYYVHS